MKRTISILEAIYSANVGYSTAPIIVYSKDDNPDSSDTTIDWGGVAPISNSDIKAEQTKLQNLEDNCYHPRRVGTATTSGYIPISDQLEKTTAG